MSPEVGPFRNKFHAPSLVSWPETPKESRGFHFHLWPFKKTNYLTEQLGQLIKLEGRRERQRIGKLVENKRTICVEMMDDIAAEDKKLDRLEGERRFSPEAVYRKHFEQKVMCEFFSFFFEKNLIYNVFILFYKIFLFFKTSENHRNTRNLLYSFNFQSNTLSMTLPIPKYIVKESFSPLTQNVCPHVK